MSQVTAAPGESDPLALMDFSSLIDGAAKLRPGRIAFHDIAGGGARALTFEQLNQRTSAMARAWAGLGLVPGERLVLVMSAGAASMVALFGALRAGLDVALASPHLEAADIAALAVSTGAAAIGGDAVCGDAVCGDIDVAQAMFHAAVSAERVRFVACTGTSSVDGAVPLDPFLLDLRQPADVPDDNQAAHSRLVTRDSDGRCVFHRQRTLVAAALDFITHTQIGTQMPIVSTILPASFAGLVCGPVAALAAGAPLILHAPFDAARLHAEIDALQPVHLVLPEALEAAFATSDLAPSGRTASLVLLSRCRQLPAHPPGALAHVGTHVVDVYAVGEIAAVAEARPADGARIAPLTQQHTLNLDGRDVVAARRKVHYLASNGRLDSVTALEGAAISQTGDHAHE